MDMSTDMKQALAAFIAAEILKQPGRQINPDESLISSGLVDSFSLVDLALFIQDTYQVRIDDTELNADTFDNINQLSALVNSRIR
jgi:acyl carrier protein